MSVLGALTSYYERLVAKDAAPPFGYATTRIGYVLVLAPDGTPLRLDQLGAPDAKPPGRLLTVPAAVKRSANIAPNFLWDKTAYVLGVIAEKADDGTQHPAIGHRTAEEHAAFRAFHQEALAGTTDDGLKAVLGFLAKWMPQQFEALGFPIAALDQNIVFRLDTEHQFIHERSAARSIWARVSKAEGDAAQCLITGEVEPIARLHPSIKGVIGAQSSGASLVSFNEAAYESHGKSQGANAPVSAKAAFAYGTALNTLLARDSRQKLRIADTTVVFWADAPEAEAEAAESLFSEALDPPVDTAADAREKLAAALDKVASGKLASDIDPELSAETRIHVLGLAPNNSRLAIRFWQSGRFGDFAKALVDHWHDLVIEPPAWKGPPAAWALLYEVALNHDAKNIPPLLGGQLMRAILTGGAYPRTLLTGIVGRIRADGDVTPRRAAICKAFLVRNLELGEGDLVSLQVDSTDIAYNLGRLFAAFAYAERSYADRQATLRDKYMGSASATPRRVFPILMRGYEHNRSALAKAEGVKRGAGIKADKAVGEIIDQYGGDVPFPAALTLEQQARFFVGFYHQDRAFYGGKKTDTDTDEPDEKETADD